VLRAFWVKKTLHANAWWMRRVLCRLVREVGDCRWRELFEKLEEGLEGGDRVAASGGHR
jgi:hypothetical protein